MTTQTLMKPWIVVGEGETNLFNVALGNCASIPQSEDKRWLKGNLSLIEREIEELVGYLTGGSHYAVENVELSGQERLSYLLSTQKHFEMALAGYPRRLDPAFLSWTREDKLPVFITLSWHTRDFSLKVIPQTGASDIYETEPELNLYLALQYFPVADHLLKEARKKGMSEITISASFAGSVPLSTKQKMQKAEREPFFDEFYLIAEAPLKWRLDSKVRVVNLDPIVFGIVKMPFGLPDHLYIIDVFDLTDIEKAAFEQYSLDPR